MTAQRPSTAKPDPVDPVERRIEPAVTAWARTVFGAPRRLHALVTAVEPRDDVIERVATHIERRQLREVRGPTGERRSTRPRVDPATADPFAYSDATLRADSEHVVACGNCGAAGRMACGGCRGTGHGSCPTCHGSGTQASPKTGRPIRCKSCRATGSAPCRNCGGAGAVPCRACLGSGHQLVWLAIERSERWEIVVPPHSPLVATLPALREHRAMRHPELATAQILDEHVASGPIDLRTMPVADRRTVAAQRERLEPRLERIGHQQYLKIAAIRRDVTFEMCGTRATLSLSGSRLLGATTPDVLRPIRRRLYLWLAICAGVLVAGLAMSTAWLGSSSYFKVARGNADLLAVLAFGCAVPATGTLLRSWRGGMRFHPIRWPTVVCAAVTGVALPLIPIVAFAARPELGEASRALAVNDVAHARAVIDAFDELHGPGAARDVEDQVMLAEAQQVQGSERLKLLDTVASHHGAVAAQAAGDARAQRLDEVRQLISAHHSSEALAALDRGFPGDRTGPVAEEHARAHEAMKDACTTPACRFGEALQADTARTTPERVDALAPARADVLQALDPKRIDAKLLLPRLQQLRRLRDAGTETAKIAPADAELQSHARDAIRWANDERAKVRLLGNNLAIIEELIGPSTTPAGGIPSIALDGETLYLVMDRAGPCTGIYAAGTGTAARTIRSNTWPPDRILSQALGAPAVMQPQSTDHPTVRWYAGGAPIVARWDAGELIELRIGDATP
ncbi:MAG TPA: hypothetical protein VH165_20410 [Kofleriaceae bacterium]|jgi:hypothetical protein|nr:hypothetical protein [Kofleriaceae bacterium]